MAKYQPNTPQLLWKAEMMNEGPFKPGKAKGSAKEGLRFQAKVHKALARLKPAGMLLDSPWFKYYDVNGSHWAQPDSVVVCSDRTIVVESKLSLRRLDIAKAQLYKLYIPILWAVFEKPVFPVVAFHHWVREHADFPTIAEPKEILTMPVRHQPIGWHLL